MFHQLARAAQAAGVLGLLSVVAAVALAPLRQSHSGSTPAAPVIASPMETLYDREAAPIFARCDLPAAEALASASGGGALAKAAAADPERALCAFFLRSLAPRFQASDPARAFRIEDGGKEGTRAWYRVRQLEQGVPVYGGEGRVAVPRGAQGGEARYLGRFRTVPGRLTAPVPAINAAEALAAARRDQGAAGGLQPVPADLAGEPSPLELAPELVWLPQETPALLRNPYASLSASPAPFRLAWNLAVRPNFLELWEYLVDAETGAILQKLPVPPSGPPPPSRATSRGWSAPSAPGSIPTASTTSSTPPGRCTIRAARPSRTCPPEPW